MVLPYRLEFEEEDDLLVVRVWGDRAAGDAAANARATWEQLAAACRDRGRSRVLVFSWVTGRYSTFDAFDANASLEQQGIERWWKIAFVNLDPPSQYALRFAETVLLNRGFNVRLFSDETAARAWLKN